MENQVNNNKIESPDYYQQMDISDNCTTDNNSLTSLSPTISNQAENDSETNLAKTSSEMVESVSSSINSLHLNVTTTIKKQDEENLENRNTLNLSSSTSSDQNTLRKLTPVHNHPLMMFDDNDSEDSSSPISNSNTRNFPDLVLMTNNNQPLRLAAKTSTSATTTTSTDLVNCVNNNDNNRMAKYKYREPSPVSNALICLN